MTDLQKQLERARKQWLYAKQRKDKIMMNLWEKMGKKIKAEIEARIKGEK